MPPSPSPDERLFWQTLRQDDQPAWLDGLAPFEEAMQAFARPFSRDEVFIREAIHAVFGEIWAQRAELNPSQPVRELLLERLRGRVAGMPETPLPLGSPEDTALWQRLLADDVTALEGLMREYSRLLFRYGTKFSPDAELIKDCIQDLFLDLWERRRFLRADVLVKPYLMVALRRRIHRTSQFQQARTSPVGEEESLFLEFSVEETYIREEATRVRAQAIRDLLAGLPQRQKEAIYLKFFEDLDRDQIAETMGVAPQSVSNLLQEALRKLRGNWKAEFLGFFWLVIF